MPSNQVTPKRIEFLRLLTRTGFASTRHLAESGLIERATEYSQSAFFKPLLEQLLVGRITVVSLGPLRPAQGRHREGGRWRERGELGPGRLPP